MHSTSISTQEEQKSKKVTKRNIRLEDLKQVTEGYKELQGVTGGYKGLQGVTGSYRGLQEVTRDYRV